jgi:actin-related protein
LCGEVLFKPSLLNSEENNIVDIVNNSIMACGRNKNYACSNIVLVGGNANIKNFNKRLSNELNNIQQIKYNIISTKPSFPIDGVNTMLKCDYSDLMINKYEYAIISESGDNDALIDLLKSKCKY